ncbi:MAG: hypothetical protein ABIP90_02590, partial [Vicinamibacterales bacterium]
YELVHNLALEVTRLGIDIHNMKMRVESVSSRMDFDERRGRALESVVQYKQSRPSSNERSQQTPRPQSPAANAPAAISAAAVTLIAPGATQADAPLAAVSQAAGLAQPAAVQADRPDGDGERRRRRRRRRRRPGQTMGDQAASPAGSDGANVNGSATWVAEGGPDEDGDSDNDQEDADDSGPVGPPDKDAQ